MIPPGLTYGEGAFTEGENTVRAQVLACARAAMFTPAHELEQLTAVVAGRPRWAIVHSELPARVVYLTARVKGAPFEGYVWTLEQIQKYVDGISEGKQRPPTQPSDCMGADKYYAEWEDGDWRAWERHPVVDVLWREVGSTAEEEPAPAAAPPPMTIEPPAADPPPAPAATSSAPSSSSGSATPQKPPAPASVPSASSAAPAPASPSRSSTSAGDRPTHDELYAATPSRAQRSGTCCVCEKGYGFEELVKEVRGYVAHFHCARQAPPKATPSVGERIRELRKAAGLTQADLARQLGIKPSKLSEVERGKDELDDEALGQLSSYLGVTKLDVVEPERPMPKVLPHPAAGRGEPANATVEDRDVKPENVLEPEPVDPNEFLNDLGLEPMEEDAWH